SPARCTTTTTRPTRPRRNRPHHADRAPEPAVNGARGPSSPPPYELPHFFQARRASRVDLALTCQLADGDRVLASACGMIDHRYEVRYAPGVRPVYSRNASEARPRLFQPTCRAIAST